MAIPQGMAYVKLAQLPHEFGLYSLINNYTIDTNQELIAIGMSNIFGPFFGFYPVTGSFLHTAIKSKAGICTPLAGVLIVTIVVIVICVLLLVFNNVSNTLLATVIIHAVGNLISMPSAVKKFWM
ncbi:hypothetical protein LPJ64_006418, partial [Coemansia asiatica]